MKGLGHYYSFTASSVALSQDLIATAASALGLNAIIPKKLTLITGAPIGIKINDASVSSTLYRDTNSLYTLSFGYDEFEIHSLVISASSASPIFLSIIY